LDNSKINIFKPGTLPVDIWKYIGVFILSIIILTLSFNFLQDIYTTIFLEPVSRASFSILKFLGLAIEFDGAGLPFGICDLILPHQTLRINFGCTGLFVLFIFIAGVIAYPSGIKYKLTGLAAGIPVFTLYSILRLVIMGFVGNWIPQYLDIIHNYLMILINIAFVLWLYISWIKYVSGKDQK
jgi:exosortase/archaeosortase family protein